MTSQKVIFKCNTIGKLSWQEYIASISIKNRELLQTKTLHQQSLERHVRVSCGNLILILAVQIMAQKSNALHYFPWLLHVTLLKVSRFSILHHLRFSLINAPDTRTIGQKWYQNAVI